MGGAVKDRRHVHRSYIHQQVEERPTECSIINGQEEVDNRFTIMGIEQPIRLVSNTSKIKSLANEFILEKNPDEAFFLCNLGEILRKHQEWVTAMPRVKPFYAVKCNDDEQVIKVLAGLGTGFDCASKGEMAKVIGLGVHPARIIFANPTKQQSHIRAAEKFDVSTMTFDNIFELHKIKVFHPTARLIVRIRCDADKAQCQLGMKFGVLVEDAPALLAAASDLGLNVVGVSFHVGSGCMDPPVFRRAIASAKWLFSVGYEIGHNMDILDIGGGFPGNFGTDITEIANVVNASIDEYFPESCGVEIIAEPGRYYVASAFYLLTQIHSMREGSNESGERSFMYYINDGVYGSFNCVLYDHAVVHPQTLRTNNNGMAQMIPCSIWGPTCDGLDQVCSQVLLPKMEMGEWLIFRNMGAYTLAAAGTFNGFPVSKVDYLITEAAWDIMKDILGYQNPIVDNVPLFLKADVGCNRDAVGWCDVGAGLGAGSCPPPAQNVYGHESDGTLSETDSLESDYVVSSSPAGMYIDIEYSET